jgi:hypothetical protein
MLTSLHVSPEKDSQVRICNDSQPVTGPRRWTCSSHQLPVTQPSAVFGSVCMVEKAEKLKGQHHNWQPGPQSASRACLVRPLPQSRRGNVRGRHLPVRTEGGKELQSTQNVTADVLRARFAQAQRCVGSVVFGRGERRVVLLGDAQE